MPGGKVWGKKPTLPQWASPIQETPLSGDKLIFVSSVSAASSHVGAVLAAAPIPLQSHPRLCKLRLPLHLTQCARRDRETGKDAGLGSRAQFVVLSFHGERGKGLHLITVKHKMLHWYTGGFPYSAHRDHQGSKSWQMEAWCNALAPSKTLSWKWYLRQGCRILAVW